VAQRCRIGDFPMTPGGTGKGISHDRTGTRVIDQLQNDPDLIGMTRVPADNPMKSR
jgi:hypothetical protein